MAALILITIIAMACVAAIKLVFWAAAQAREQAFRAIESDYRPILFIAAIAILLIWH